MSINQQNSPGENGLNHIEENASRPVDTVTSGETALNGEPALEQITSIPPSPGLLELIYGILFDPVRTFRRLAQWPPLGQSVLLFSLVKIMSALVWGYSLSLKLTQEDISGLDLGIGGALKMMVPVAVIMLLVYEYLKWFVYSGTLYLLAELAGGRGRASGVLVATGLAALPALLFLPVQVLLAAFGGDVISGVGDVIIWLAMVVWGFILVVIGLRETQEISTGRAVLVALTPALTIIFILVLAIMLLAGIVAPLAQLLE